VRKTKNADKNRGIAPMKMLIRKLTVDEIERVHVRGKVKSKQVSRRSTLHMKLEIKNARNLRLARHDGSLWIAKNMCASEGDHKNTRFRSAIVSSLSMTQRKHEKMQAAETKGNP
jgi:hypothetical protein